MRRANFLKIMIGFDLFVLVSWSIIIVLFILGSIEEIFFGPTTGVPCWYTLAGFAMGLCMPLNVKSLIEELTELKGLSVGGN